MTEENRGGEVEHDLLGDPVVPIRDPRGRKSAVGSSGIRKECQRVVMSLRAAGQTQEQIADFLCMDVKTLVKHFSRELDGGASLLEGLAMQVLVKRMLDGNVSAADKVLKIAQLRSGLRPAKSEGAKKDPPPGKKEQQKAAAGKPTGTWGNVLPGIDRPN